MKILNLSTNQINQNGYHKTILTREKIGALYTFPIDFTPEDCLACDGYSLEIVDYKELYKVIGDKFKQSEDAVGTFRIPDYNISKRFLQPGSNAGVKIEAGLPNITGAFGVGDSSGTSTSGAFYTISGSRWNEGGCSRGSNPDIGFNASRSSSIYGKSSTVQPASQIVHICIRYQ